MTENFINQNAADIKNAASSYEREDLSIVYTYIAFLHSFGDVASILKSAF